MVKKILITGGAGCLGSNLLEHFFRQGHEILVIDNFATGRREVVPDIDGLQLIEGSVTDKKLVDQTFDDFKPEVVIHSAASYKDPHDWRGDARTNVEGTINVAQSSMRTGVRKLVHFQTALCYGNPDRLPIPVDHPLRPFTSYGISKTAGELYLLQSSLPVTSLRLANVTGPRLSIGPIPTFYKRLKEGKPCFCSNTKRDFLDMEDFHSLMNLVISEDSPSGVFNVSSGESKSMQEVFQAVCNYLSICPEQPPPLVEPSADDVQEVVLDPSRTEEAFGWRAQVGFEETIRRMLSWYDQHGVSAIYSHLSEPKKN